MRTRAGAVKQSVGGYRYIELKINEQGKDRIYACRSVHCGGDVGSSRNVLIQKRGSAMLPVIAVEYKGLSSIKSARLNTGPS
jgi:hypothetical protein